MIGPTGRPVAMQMEPKKEKNRRLRVTISRMRRHAAFEPIDPNYTCMWGGEHDVIDHAFFFKIDPRVVVLADPKYGISH